MQKFDNFDNGKPFDWGEASADYAKYRDIYPGEFYDRIRALGVGAKGTSTLDIGTGTGVLPRNMARYGGSFTGVDLSGEQIAQAKHLMAEQGLCLDFYAGAAEDMSFAPESFDYITACQCFFYFDHEKLAPLAARLLKKGGKLCVLYMGWLSFEDEIAGKSEALIQKYNPDWSGGGDREHINFVPSVYDRYFKREREETFRLDVPFTRESWNGRIRACRGIGASLPPEKIGEFSAEHLELLAEIAPESFKVKHYAAFSVLELIDKAD